MAKEPKHEKFYKDSPKLERDDESGDMKVSKGEKKSVDVQNGTDGAQRDEAMPHHVRHAKERHDMHSRHEHEHSMYDHAGQGDKHEMHERHHGEMKAMHKRHEKEVKTGTSMIDKVEKNEEE